jgi:hypothetical protein
MYVCTKAVTIRFCGVLEGSAYTCVRVVLQLDQRTEHNRTVLLLTARLLSISDSALATLTAVHLVNKFSSFISLKDHYHKGIAMEAVVRPSREAKTNTLNEKKKGVICTKLQI